MTEYEYYDNKFNYESSKINMYYETLCEFAMKPSINLHPRLFIDGDMWCALYGENLQDGVCGFGKSPRLALEDFDRNIEDKLKCEN